MHLNYTLQYHYITDALWLSCIWHQRFHCSAVETSLRYKPFTYHSHQHPFPTSVPPYFPASSPSFQHLSMFHPPDFPPSFNGAALRNPAGLLLSEAFGAPVDGQEAAELFEVQLAVPVFIHHCQRLRFGASALGTIQEERASFSEHVSWLVVDLEIVRCCKL